MTLWYISSRKLIQVLKSSCLLTLFHFAWSFIEYFFLQALITWEVFTCMCLILCLPFLFSVVKACVFHIHSYSPSFLPDIWATVNALFAVNINEDIGQGKSRKQCLQVENQDEECQMLTWNQRQKRPLDFVILWKQLVTFELAVSGKWVWQKP